MSRLLAFWLGGLACCAAAALLILSIFAGLAVLFQELPFA